MEFTVHFTTDRIMEYAFSQEESYFGFREIDRIREELNVPDLNLERIQNKINYSNINPIITINEKLARKNWLV